MDAILLQEPIVLNQIYVILKVKENLYAFGLYVVFEKIHELKESKVRNNVK